MYAKNVLINMCNVFPKLFYNQIFQVKSIGFGIDIGDTSPVIIWYWIDSQILSILAGLFIFYLILLCSVFIFIMCSVLECHQKRFK